MLTSSKISTISYNSESFLKNKLDDLVQHNHIDFYFYIYHNAEADEKKSHFHVWLYPSGRLDTHSLQLQFLEYVQGSDIPLKVMPFRKSNFQDAYLYDIHDKQYLAMKMEEKKFHYSIDDIVTSDRDFLLDCVHQIDWSKIKKGCPASVIRESILNGVSWWDMVDSGLVPAQQYSGWHKIYEVIYAKYVSMNPETGEIGYIPVPRECDAPEEIQEYNLDDLN